MGSFKSFALAGVFAVAASTAALAADLLPPPPPFETIAPQPIEEFGSGWYLRGDVGVSAYEGAKFSSPDLPPAKFHGEEFGSGAFVAAGVGYQFTNWFRADITGEYRFSTGVKAHDLIEFEGDKFRNTYAGDYSAFVGLVNAYFDLGTWNGITPFVGVGVGFTRNHLHGFHETALNDVGGITSVSGGDLGDGSKTNFAWAVHAGLAYDVTPNFKVELAYRYLNLGEGKTGSINCYCGQIYSPLKVKDLESHDFKIGMRWLLAASVPTPLAAPIPAPIISKY